MAEKVYGAKCDKAAVVKKQAEFQNKQVAVSQKMLRMKFQALLIRKRTRETERRAARSVKTKLRKLRKSDEFMLMKSTKDPDEIGVKAFVRLRGGGDESEVTEVQETEVQEASASKRKRLRCKTSDNMLNVVKQETEEESIENRIVLYEEEIISKDEQIVKTEDEASKPKRKEVQFSLMRFFKPDEKHVPVLESMTLRKRGRKEEFSAKLKAMIAESVKKEQEEKAVVLSEEGRLQLIQEAKRYGRLGGRPPNHLSRYNKELRLSNRRKPFEKPLKREIPQALKLKMVDEMKELRVQYPDAASFFKDMRKRFGGMRRHQLEDLMATETKLKHSVSKQKMRQKRFQKRRGEHYVRSEGAGRKREHPELIEKLSGWINDERSHGHTILKRHLMSKWMELLLEKIQDIEASVEKKDDEISKRLEESKLAKVKKTLSSLKQSESYRKTQVTRLISWCEAKHCRPHLTTKLSPLEEQVRAQVTWMSFDHMLAKAAFGAAKDLEDSVAKTEEFVKNREHLVLGFSDQIPLWVKKGSEREIFAKFEAYPESQEDLRKRLREHLLAKAEEHHEPKKEKAIVEVEKPKPDAEGQKQLRSRKETHADRYRITYEARQIVRRYLSGDPNQLVSGIRRRS